MLNTVMALWNQHPGANKPRIVKLFFTFLLISFSTFLLLFTLDSSTWSLVPGKEQIKTQKAAPLGVRNHNVVATTGETPVHVNSVVSVAPTATRTLVQVCIHTPTVVVKPSVVPQKVAVYTVNNSLDHKMSRPHHVRPKIERMHVHKNKRHLRKRSHIKAIATPIPQETSAAIPPSPPPATPQPMLTPDVTATVAATPVPVEETPVSSMPDIVTIDLTPDIATTSTDPFVQSLRQKGSIHISVSPEARSTKKTSTKTSDRVYEYVKCDGGTIYKYGRTGTVLKVKRRIGFLLGSSLLGTVLLCCLRFAHKRKKFANFLNHFKISSKTP